MARKPAPYDWGTTSNIYRYDTFLYKVSGVSKVTVLNINARLKDLMKAYYDIE
jgi:hypothetical protein